MKKTEKKIENRIIKALTLVCDQALDYVEGFVWLTHFADFEKVDKTLLIIAVFQTEQQRREFQKSKQSEWLEELIVQSLLELGVKINLHKQLVFDSEEACKLEHGGSWRQRLARH